MRNVLMIRREIVFLLLLALLSGCAGAFGGGSWQAGGLQGQHIRALAVDPNNPQHIYAGDAQEGIFVSTDGGQHWTTQNTVFPLPATIFALAFDYPGKKLYAMTGTGIVVSADAGQHWSALGTAETGVGSGLPIDGYTTVAFDANAVHTLYAGTMHHGVLVSTNDGVVWSNISTGLPVGIAVNAITFDAEHHQLWAATTAGIYRSDNQGAVWQALNTGLPVDVVTYAVQPASINGGVAGLIYAGTNHGFYLSQDDGAHWSTGTDSLTGTSVRMILVDFRQSQAIALFVATDVGVFSSNNSGQTWGAVAGGLPRGTHVYALALGAAAYAQLYAAANAVYLFPGSSGGFTIDRLFPVLLVILFFYLLYRLTSRNRNRSREMLKPERIMESPDSWRKPR